MVNDGISVEVDTVKGRRKSKKWIVLGAVATALLIIPRRSSRKADIILSGKNNVNSNNDRADDHNTGTM